MSVLSNTSDYIYEFKLLKLLFTSVLLGKIYFTYISSFQCTISMAEGLEPPTSPPGVRSNHESSLNIVNKHSKLNTICHVIPHLRDVPIRVIQPHLPIRLPCYDFPSIICPTFDGCSKWLLHRLVLQTPRVTGGVQDPGTYSPACHDY